MGLLMMKPHQDLIFHTINKMWKNVKNISLKIKLIFLKLDLSKGNIIKRSVQKCVLSKLQLISMLIINFYLQNAIKIPK
jgi:hypothetical protein